MSEQPETGQTEDADPLRVTLEVPEYEVIEHSADRDWGSREGEPEGDG